MREREKKVMKECEFVSDVGGLRAQKSRIKIADMLLYNLFYVVSCYEFNSAVTYQHSGTDFKIFSSLLWAESAWKWH